MGIKYSGMKGATGKGCGCCAAPGNPCGTGCTAPNNITLNWSIGVNAFVGNPTCTHTPTSGTLSLVWGGSIFSIACPLLITITGDGVNCYSIGYLNVSVTYSCPLHSLAITTYFDNTPNTCNTQVNALTYTPSSWSCPPLAVTYDCSSQRNQGPSLDNFYFSSLSLSL